MIFFVQLKEAVHGEGLACKKW